MGLLAGEGSEKRFGTMQANNSPIPTGTAGKPTTYLNVALKPASAGLSRAHKSRDSSQIIQTICVAHACFVIRCLCGCCADCNASIVFVYRRMVRV